MLRKSVEVTIAEIGEFITRASDGLATMTAFHQRLVADERFATLWQSDPAAALRQAGIDPDARQELGFLPYSAGGQREWCITPRGRACHC